MLIGWADKALDLAECSDLFFKRWSSTAFTSNPIADLYPDLAVEVLSPSNTKREMKNKRVDYFAWGTRLVWQLEPNAQVMEVFTAPEESVMITISGSLDGGEVLPGFSLPMTKLFEDTDRFLD